MNQSVKNVLIMSIVISDEYGKRVDGSRQEAKVEITEAVKPPEDEPGEGDEKPQESEIEIELPDDEKIVVDDVEVPPDESGGGFDGNVSDWDDETNVELPVG